MFAVVKTGGKQYRVAENDVIKVERLPGEAGDTVTLDEVLMIGGEGKAEVGNPTLAGKAVEAEILEQARGDKIVIFKRKRRKGYRRKNGHRQDLTVLRVKRIGDAAKKATKAKSAKSTKGEMTPAAETAKTDKAAKPAAPKKTGTAASKGKSGAKASSKPSTSKE